MNLDQLDLHLPTDIPDWPPSIPAPTAWLEEQRQVIAESLSRNDPRTQLRHFQETHETAEPFVWRE